MMSTDQLADIWEDLLLPAFWLRVCPSLSRSPRHGASVPVAKRPMAEKFGRGRFIVKFCRYTSCLKKKNMKTLCKVEKIHLNTNPNQLDNPILNKHHGFLLAGPSGARFGPKGPWNQGIMSQDRGREPPGDAEGEGCGQSANDFYCEFAGKWPKHSGLRIYNKLRRYIFRVEGLLYSVDIIFWL